MTISPYTFTFFISWPTENFNCTFKSYFQKIYFSFQNWNRETAFTHLEQEFATHLDLWEISYFLIEWSEGFESFGIGDVGESVTIYADKFGIIFFENDLFDGLIMISIKLHFN